MKKTKMTRRTKKTRRIMVMGKMKMKMNRKDEDKFVLRTWTWSQL